MAQSVPKAIYALNHSEYENVCTLCCLKEGKAMASSKGNVRNSQDLLKLKQLSILQQMMFIDNVLIWCHVPNEKAHAHVETHDTDSCGSARGELSRHARTTRLTLGSACSELFSLRSR